MDYVYLFEIIDGQHRLCGISQNPDSIKELPIIILFDLTEEEKAYIFSTINSNQRKVPSSLIYDLFELYETRSPSKTCHELAKTFNCDRNSPFYNRLKMLGRKIQGSETISQGSFVQYIEELFTKDAKQDAIDIKNNKRLKELDSTKYVLREWFINNEDDKIYKVLFNYFTAVSRVFSKEWSDNNGYILLKTTGFGALCKSFPYAFNIGAKTGYLSLDFFEKLFNNSQKNIVDLKKILTADFYGSGEASQNKLKNDIIEQWCLQ